MLLVLNLCCSLLAAWRCYAYARAREETRSTRNGSNGQGTNQQESGMNGYQIENNLDSTYDSMELGRR